MKLYLAGLYTSNFEIGGRLYNRLTEAEKGHRNGVRYYLESYHYVNRQSYVDRMRKNGVKVFLDSGAFSAFTKGVEVDLEAYCRYIQENADIVDVASVLDGIGNPQLTWENQQRMEKLGTRPLPCFHYGEDERYLEYYVANYDYITLGGMVPISTPQLKMWLDRLWEVYLTDGSGKPRTRVHGFGLTTLSLMKRYPWYSVDSSSWVQIAAMGNILIPDKGIIAVSNNSPAMKQAGRHVDNIPELQRNGCYEEITKRGFEVPRVQQEYVTRWVFNCATFKEINLELEKKPYLYHTDQIHLF